jgi:hypothetical protein
MERAARPFRTQSIQNKDRFILATAFAASLDFMGYSTATLIEVGVIVITL